MCAANFTNPRRASTGISSLDYILGRGLPENYLYLVQGNPGSGKTTLGLQFLLNGVKNGETGLYVTLSETREELVSVAASHGWVLDGIEIHELAPSEDSLNADTQYTMFEPSELELSDTTNAILSKVKALKPTRVVFDSLSEMRLLAQSALRYRRQILGLKQFFKGRGSTLLLLDDKTSAANDIHLESLAHGVIDLEQLAPEYGAERRRLRISKLRGVRYRGGYHDFVIRTGGVDLFPRLVASDTRRSVKDLALVHSGLAGLDSLLGGGLELGTSALIMGPAGAGKSSLGLLYAATAAKQGMYSHLFIFDESRATLLRRAASIDDSIVHAVESGLIRITQIDPAEISPGEFAARLRRAAEGEGDNPACSIIVIDSLNGYLASMPEERSLVIQLHEMLSYLGQQGVLTLMIVAQHGLTDASSTSPVDTSYLADAVILLRYFEAGGHVRQAISVVKKRTGSHERAIREFSFRDGRLQVGEPLNQFQGVLRGGSQFCRQRA